MKKIILVLAVGLSSLALAKKNTVTDPLNDVDQDYQVPIQSAQQDWTPSRVLYVPHSVDFELSLSSWLPNGMSRPSAVTSAGNFDQANVPEVSLNRLGSIRDFGNGKLESLLGFSYAQLTRNGSMQLPSGTSGVSETINLASLRLGVAYRFNELYKGWVQPSLTAAVLPTWIAAGETEIEPQGASAVGFPLEVGLQVLVCPPGMRSLAPNSGAGFGLGAHYTMGQVGGSDMTGTGVDAIARIVF